MADDQERVVTTPDGIRHHFPAGTPDAVISRATGAIPAANAASAPKARTWTDVAVDALPTAGGMIGGIAGSFAGPATAVGGAIAGGMTGERLKQYANAARGVEPLPNTGDAITRMGVQGATQGAAELTGVGVGAAMTKGATPLMRAALGRTDETMTAVPDVAKIALNKGVTVTREGIKKLDNLLASRTGNFGRPQLEATREAVAHAWKKGGLPENPTIAALALAATRNPSILSAMSQGLYHAAAFMSGITPQAIRLALFGAEEAGRE